MNIVFKPADKSWPADKYLVTNIGEFRPNVPRGVSESQEIEAERLIANGEFEKTDAVAPISGKAKGHDGPEPEPEPAKPKK